MKVFFNFNHQFGERNLNVTFSDVERLGRSKTTCYNPINAAEVVDTPKNVFGTYSIKI